MGLTVTRAAQWSSSSTDKLESTALNHSLLEEIVNFVEKLGSKHQLEAEHLFEEPLQWNTTLGASDFQAGYDVRDSAVWSHEKDSEGQPLLQLSPPTVYVRSFSQLSKFLHLAHDRKFQEVQMCLEENRDPIIKIFGQNFLSKLGRPDAPSEVRRFGETSEKDCSVLELDVKEKLLLLLQNADKQILNKLLGEITEKVKLDPTAVKQEVEFLEQCCTEGKKMLLKSLRYTSDYEFSNGCRAPLWRQALGEICYLVVEACDAETLFITCSSAGVFLNAGFKQEGDESHFERKSDFYKDIATLLKSRSPHFAENISKKVFVGQDRSKKSAKRIQLVNQVDGEKRGPRHKSEEQQENDEWERLRQALYSRKRPETCQKWRDFDGLTVNGAAEQQTARKNSAEKNLRQRPKNKMKAESSVSSSPGHTSSQRMKISAGTVFEERLSESSTESEEEEEQPGRRSETNADLPTEYWQIQKLVKYLKAADQIATVLILCAMMELDLSKETCQLAMQDLGGLEILLNLLDTKDMRCKIGSLKILTKISQNVQLRQTIVHMKGLQRMVNNLDSPVKELQALAAENIANVAKFCRARRIVRQHGGIRKLVKLLDCFSNAADLRANMEDLKVARCGASALWSCSRSSKNKEAIRRAGGIPLLGRLLRSPDENMLIPVVGTLQECASQETYRVAIQTEGMMKDLVKNLSSNNDELQMLCASAIFKCAENQQTRDLVRRYNGLQPLVSLLAKADNKQLLAAATGAIWKCSASMENVAIFQESKALQILICLLTDQPEEVLVNVVGALGQFAQIRANKTAICNSGGIKALINLLNGTNKALLINVTKAVGACATDKDNAAIIDQLDGVRLVWSLLKNPSAEVQSSAAWALCPCIENAKDVGEMVLFLIGGLELVVNLLKSTNNEVLTSVCAVVAKLAKDKEILGVLTDRGVVPLLARLTNTTDNKLRCFLAEAIGHCCMWSTNRASFGEFGAVGPLVRYLKSKHGPVLLSTVMALYQLSKEPHNIVSMYEEGVVQPLIHLLASDDAELQEFAAGCLRNIRLLALANQRNQKH